MRPLTIDQREISHRLRRNQTDAERRLWSHLRNRQLEGAKFRRQLPLGSYVVDFCCLEVGVIIELDGAQHNERSALDAKRSQELERQGFRVLRFWNHEVFENIRGVLERIGEEIERGREEGQRYVG